MRSQFFYLQSMRGQSISICVGASDVSFSCPCLIFFFFFSSRRRHTRFDCDWSSDVCSSDLHAQRAYCIAVDRRAARLSLEFSAPNSCPIRAFTLASCTSQRRPVPMNRFQHIQVPAEGQKITVNADMSLNVPDQPIIPFIEGDGTGVDITPVMIKVVDAAVARAYGGKRKIQWMEVFAGEKSTRIYGPDVWLPEETMQALREYVVSIKGPLTTPVGGGIRSLNVALRQELDLYVCLRPVQYFKGVPSPLKEPEKTNMVIFRENSEDIYAGIEYEARSDNAKKLIDFLVKEMRSEERRVGKECRSRWSPYH